MQLRYRYRLYPTPGQRQALARAFGCARVVYNDAVRARQDAHKAGEKYPTGTVLQKRLITDAKKTAERAWLAEAPAQMLQQTIRDCDAAYKNFFDSLKGKRAGRKIGAPRFKSRKDDRQAIRFTRGAFTLRGNGRLALAKIGCVKVAWSRDLPSAPSSVTVVKTADDRYFASFVVEVGDETLPPAVDTDGSDIEIGLDLGLSAFAVDQNGRIIDNPRFLRRAERRLKRLQRAVSRKLKGSNNRAKARRRLARQHAKVTDTRQDWLYKATTSIVRENQTIVLEDLAVSGLARTRLAKSVHDASWGAFRRLLEEKSARYGRDLLITDRWLPTSQTCSDCGRIDGPKSLFLNSGEAFADGVDHGPADHGFVMFGAAFVVAHAAAMLVDPGQSAFHDPSTWQDNEPHLTCEFRDDFDADPEQRLGPVDERACVAGIGPDQADTRAQIAQASQEVASGDAVLGLGTGHEHADQETERIHSDVAFTAVDLLARVEAPTLCANGLGGFDRGGVDTAGAGSSTTPLGQSRTITQSVEQRLSGSD
ncbi:IS605 OrfB family transposase [Saccharopolyspora erythraea NRRL 2338]|uniref:Transposase, IS605 OrfB family n=2 Tax=Saccharopolyspora erythraea TaxID=1836 RepID=A4FDA9_SACEN|nr:RNA-guided endonuclease TnpB family protein [Saccharopolyspora erythraea]EQD81315.1 transposase IS605 [Saccharopolyspora erythraea D]PFG95777.1 IS605 OrfB family transposase [Saccharopolyspora erythraea NRRL 2338]CAM02034.1 transposase, IS605 OrfB family [Saccharopolyspora erythraea NRRL 2338]